MTKIELLAPAKDLNCGTAAINCGADAVYIGAPRFGAREAAGNSLDDIEKLVKHAHKYWAKVYATVNTLIRDSEIPAVFSLIANLYDIGVDALIIQDPGLLECNLPPIPLIASTQMHNNTPDKVAFLEKVGFQRVILARELDLSEIKAIREKTKVELECFVHGALCVSYSGQCYLSYALGGRSGNRGECAQPCRKAYTLADSSGKWLEREKHLLSLRDLNLSESLAELLDAGITSFKIEGRLKDKAYVSNVVAYYRAKLDEAMAGSGRSRSSSGTSQIDFQPDLSKTFNRGYTKYFLNGGSEPVGSIETPKMVGEKMGTVTSISGHTITLDCQAPLHPGDGVCFFNKPGRLQGSVVNAVNGSTFTMEKLQGIETGSVVFRNHDHEFLTKLDKSRPERRIDVSLTLKDITDGIELIAIDEDGNEAKFSVVCDRIAAEKPEQALANIRKQLAKLGDTEFSCREVDVETGPVLFLPISTLNALRRGALDQLTSVRATNRPVWVGGFTKNRAPYPEKQLTYLGNVLNRRTEAFYRRHGVTNIEPAAESGLDISARKLMTTRYCLRRQLDMCPGKALAEPLFLIDADGNRLELRFDCEACGMEVYLADE